MSKVASFLESLGFARDSGDVRIQAREDATALVFGDQAMVMREGETRRQSIHHAWLGVSEALDLFIGANFPANITSRAVIAGVNGTAY
jgi:hypothetical protein